MNLLQHSRVTCYTHGYMDLGATIVDDFERSLVVFC